MDLIMGGKSQDKGRTSAQTPAAGRPGRSNGPQEFGSNADAQAAMGTEEVEETGIDAFYEELYSQDADGGTAFKLALESDDRDLGELFNDEDAMDRLAKICSAQQVATLQEYGKEFSDQNDAVMNAAIFNDGGIRKGIETLHKRVEGQLTQQAEDHITSASDRGESPTDGFNLEGIGGDHQIWASVGTEIKDLLGLEKGCIALHIGVDDGELTVSDWSPGTMWSSATISISEDILVIAKNPENHVEAQRWSEIFTTPDVTVRHLGGSALLGMPESFQWHSTL